MGRSRSRERHSRRRRRSNSTSSDDSDDYAQSRRSHRHRTERHSSSSHHTTKQRSSHSGQQRTSAAKVPYTIPASAPRVQVPADLPVEVTSFVDLFAQFVCRGGPLFEDEIKAREKHNSYFAFLHAPWNDPILLYYRWRLYSMLQEGVRRASLKWSTEPFQMEQGGDAVVWIPPPNVKNGCDHFVAVATNAEKAAIEAVCKGYALKRRELDEFLRPLVESSVTPSSSWLSKMVTSDESFFTALKKSEMNQWKALVVDEVEDLWRKSIAGTQDNEEISMESLSRFRNAVLHSEYVGERMCFAVDKKEAGVHCLSVVLDTLTVMAGMVIALSKLPPTRTVHVLMGKYLSACLSMLFILHDVAKNATATPQSTEATATTIPSIPVYVPKTQRSPLLKALEWMSSTVTETVLSVACHCCKGHVTTNLEQEHTASGVLDDHDPEPTVTVRIAAESVPAADEGAEVRLASLQLLSWWKAIVTEWCHGCVVSTRCSMKLQSSYSFLIGRTIEVIGQHPAC